MLRDVFGCYLTSGTDVSHSFMKSVQGLLQHDANGPRRLGGGDLTHARTSSGGIPASRNALTKMWLDETEAEWMWMVDSDMGFAPDTLDRLLATDKPVVGALCFSWRPEEPDGLGGYRCRPAPTIFGWDGQGFKLVSSYPYNELMRVGATGAACLLIKRSVAQEIRNLYGDDWWTPVRYEDGDFLSEDLSFCYRAGSINWGVWVDTRVKTTHAKTIWVGEEHWVTWTEKVPGE